MCQSRPNPTLSTDMSATARHLRVPNANNPELLGRLLELVARGLRSTRSLAEALGVRDRTARYYLQAGTWLGLLEEEGEPQLTDLGLAWVYGEEDERPRVYARAVWSTPLVLELMAGRAEGVPDADEVAVAIANLEPDLAPTTARRRASAVLGLLTPALRLSPTRAGAKTQLRLPFAGLQANQGPERIDLTWGERSPDVVRFVLACLLDHGEITLGHLRGLLDAAGANDVAIGGPVEQVLRRADANRHEDRLVVTLGALSRRELADSGAAVALSDPAYREYLERVVDHDPQDRAQVIEVERGRREFRLWDQRVLGGPADAATLHAALDGILLERSLKSFPRAGGAPMPVPVVDVPFLDALDRPLTVAAPPVLARLTGGVRGVNAELERMRRQHGVGCPTLGDTTVAVHGGLWAPGETPPKAIPDTTSLRLRLVTHSPFPAMLIALLLLHRRGVPVRIERRGEPWHVRVRGKVRGTLMEVLDAFATDQGWRVCRRRRGGLVAQQLLEGLGALGMVTMLGELAVLDESFFARLTREVEQLEVHEQLTPLTDRWTTWLADRRAG